GRVARHWTDHGADNVSDGIGVEPALLQNLTGQPFNPFSDRLVFGSREARRLPPTWSTRACDPPWLVGVKSLAGFGVGQQDTGRRPPRFFGSRAASPRVA